MYEICNLVISLFISIRKLILLLMNVWSWELCMFFFFVRVDVFRLVSCENFNPNDTNGNYFLTRYFNRWICCNHHRTTMVQITWIRTCRPWHLYKFIRMVILLEGKSKAKNYMYKRLKFKFECFLFSNHKIGCFWEEPIGQLIPFFFSTSFDGEKVQL